MTVYKDSWTKGSALTPIHRDPEEHHSPPVGMGAYEDQVKNEVEHQVQFTMGLREPQLHPAAILHLFPPLTHLTPWGAASKVDCTG